MHSQTTGLTRGLVGSGMHWFRKFERDLSQEAERASRRVLFVKNPLPGVSRQRDRRAALQSNLLGFRALPFCRCTPRKRSSGRVGWTNVKPSQHGQSGNLSICRGLRVVSTCAMDPRQSNSWKNRGYPSLRLVQNKQAATRKPGCPDWFRQECRDLERRYNEVTVPALEAEGCRFVKDWTVVLPSEGASRKLKRRAWFAKRVVKKLPSHARTGAFTVDMSRVYKATLKLRQTLRRRRMVPGMLVKYFRRNAGDGCRWSWGKRRRK